MFPPFKTIQVKYLKLWQSFRKYYLQILRKVHFYLQTCGVVWFSFLNYETGTKTLQWSKPKKVGPPNGFKVGFLLCKNNKDMIYYLKIPK